MTKLSSYQVDEYLVRRILENLVIEYTGVNEITIFQGSTIGADDGSRVLVAASDLVIDGTTTGKNALDTGSLAASTWYYIFMITNPDTDEVAGLISASMTSPTMPAGFTKKRLAGVAHYVTTDFRTFAQTNLIVSSYVSIVSGYVGTTRTNLSLAAIVPTITESIQSSGSAYDNIGTTTNPSASFYNYSTTDLVGVVVSIAIDATPTGSVVRVNGGLPTLRYPRSGTVSCKTGGGTAGEMLYWTVSGYTLKL